MHDLSTTGPQWLSLALFPFKAYTALAYMAVQLWNSHLPPRADYTEAGGIITLGYLAIFAALCGGGMLQKSISPRQADLVPCAFASADLIFVVLMLPYLAHT